MEFFKRDDSNKPFNIEKIKHVLDFAFHGLSVSKEVLEIDAQNQFRNGMKTKEIQEILIKTAVEKISPQEPDWEYAAARLLLYDLYQEVGRTRGHTLKDKINDAREPYSADRFLVLLKKYTGKYYGRYLTRYYSEEEIAELGSEIDGSRDLLFNYSRLKILIDKYLVRNNFGEIIELPQEMYMLVAMTLAIPEENRVFWAKEFYTLLSKHEVYLASTTLMNARRSSRNMMSCFVLAVKDDLHEIFDNIGKAVEISRYRGGLGIYLGKIRSSGSHARNIQGTYSGTIPIVRLINDVISLANQQEMMGNATATLDIWHKDILEFLEIKSNSIHTAVAIPDLFMKRVIDNGEWTLIDPYYARKYLEPYRTAVEKAVRTYGAKVSVEKREEIIILKFQIPTWSSFSGALNQIKKDLYSIYKEKAISFVKHLDGFFQIEVPKIGLEDLYGTEFEKAYRQLELNPRIPDSEKLTIKASDLWKKILTTCLNTGELLIFFRDIANRLNPNNHLGMIYSSSPCMAVLQNISPSEQSKNQLDLVTGRIVSIKKAGETGVCNICSINLEKVFSKENIQRVVPTLVRMLDNMIELNNNPILDAEFTSRKYRAIGIGVSNYNYCLVRHGIDWESERHLKFADKLFELIAFYALEGSVELAKEREKYPAFDGSDWSNGKFFGKTVEELEACSARNGNFLDWKGLEKKVKAFGIRNAYLLALTPTELTSPSGRYNILHKWLIKAVAVRQKWIDQGQFLQVFIDPQKDDNKKLAEISRLAWKSGLKTLHFLRIKPINED